jgi:hypothetical protein
LGCWSETCGLTNLNIDVCNEVVCWIFRYSPHDHNNGVPLTLPFFGTYDDYGGLEEINNSDCAIILAQSTPAIDLKGNTFADYFDSVVRHEVEVEIYNESIKNLDARYKFDKAGANKEDPAIEQSRNAMLEWYKANNKQPVELFMAHKGAFDTIINSHDGFYNRLLEGAREAVQAYKAQDLAELKNIKFAGTSEQYIAMMMEWSYGIIANARKTDNKGCKLFSTYTNRGPSADEFIDPLLDKLLRDAIDNNATDEFIDSVLQRWCQHITVVASFRMLRRGFSPRSLGTQAGVSQLQKNMAKWVWDKARHDLSLAKRNKDYIEKLYEPT